VMTWRCDHVYTYPPSGSALFSLCLETVRSLRHCRHNSLPTHLSTKCPETEPLLKRLKRLKKPNRLDV
jgi:hypothetical protein